MMINKGTILHCCHLCTCNFTLGIICWASFIRDGQIIIRLITKVLPNKILHFQKFINRMLYSYAGDHHRLKKNSEQVHWDLINYYSLNWFLPPLWLQVSGADGMTGWAVIVYYLSSLSCTLLLLCPTKSDLNETSYEWYEGKGIQCYTVDFEYLHKLCWLGQRVPQTQQSYFIREAVVCHIF